MGRVKVPYQLIGLIKLLFLDAVQKETIRKSKTGISFWRGEVGDTVNLKSASSSAP